MDQRRVDAHGLILREVEIRNTGGLFVFHDIRVVFLILELESDEIYLLGSGEILPEREWVAERRGFRFVFPFSRDVKNQAKSLLRAFCRL